MAKSKKIIKYLTIEKVDCYIAEGRSHAYEIRRATDDMLLAFCHNPKNFKEDMLAYHAAGILRDMAENPPPAGTAEVTYERRKQLVPEDIDSAMRLVHEWTVKRLDQKGWGRFVSPHEILGIITNEYHELDEAVHKKDALEFRHELIDLAVAALLGIATIDMEER
ncbi:MAG: hypothetical protein WC517_04525 [Patescibacteria group bacterium]